ncbi:MAG: hypothetical protein K8S23_00455 [Candidatus Cloacimonetes bacterium]|nr:hypothetical protein [Candidatus Cloacimonadota bacterium]
MKQNTAINNIDSIIFSIFCGIVATFWNYFYGLDNHIEQLPILMRAIDNSYLINDFFTNATSGFGPRYYFVHSIAWLGNFVSIPMIFFVFTLLSNISISIITYLFSRDFFNNSKFAGIVASILVMSVSTIRIGSTPVLFLSYLEPYSVALPLVLLSFLYAIRKNLILTGLFSGIAAIIHPLFGLGSGAILLLSYFVLNILEGNKLLKDYFQIFIGSAILICLSLINLIPHFQAEIQQISSEEFIDILAHFRHPHHYIPSYILSIKPIILSITFLGAVAITWYLWQKKSESNKHQSKYIFTVSIIIILLCIGGYIFVELIPSRFLVTAQTFRFLNIIKWIALILFSGTIIYAFSDNKNKICNFSLFISVLSPITVFIALSSNVIENFIGNRKSFLSNFRFFFKPVIALVLIVSYLIIKPTTSIYLFSFFSFVVLIILYRSRKFFYSIISLTLLFILLNSFYFPKIDLPSKFESKLSKFFRPKFQLSDYSGDNIEIADYIKQNTEVNAVFLIPPLLGELRLFAKRAVVVDFKAFVFQEPEMLQWKERILDCYGIAKSNGFVAAEEFDENYKTISDSKIEYLRNKYNISFAILYNQTETKFPVLYENSTYKLVEVK